MNFVSLQYAFFLLIVFFFFYSLPHRHQWKLLLIASTVFYMISIPVYVVIPLIIGLVSYGGGILIERTQRPDWKKAILLISLFVNVGVLIFFKYVDFIIKSFLKVFNFIQIHLFHVESVVNNPWAFNLLVPLGISYITFQAIGYIIEIYRGNHPAERNIGLYFTYLMFFPKLFSGPIERAHHFLPQLHEKKIFDYHQASDGLKLIVWGLFKKLVIAENLGLITNPVFNSPDKYTGTPVILASLFFTVQLYADFSGYTDIAIGSANVLGFKLMKNFEFPFIAKSTTELWRRWHISLSTWFFEYVYNPIAIAKRSWDKWAVVYASLLTFLLLGLWHEASWKFVIFGLLQGIVLSIEFLTRKLRKAVSSRLPGMVNDCVGVVFTFCFFSFALIFFRSNILSDAVTIIKHLFSFSDAGGRINSLTIALTIQETLMAMFWVSFLLIVEHFDRNFDLKKVVAKQALLLRWAIYYTVIFTILTFGVCQQSQFIYFKF